jgi:hypothetical protein
LANIEQKTQVMAVLTKPLPEHIKKQDLAIFQKAQD